MKTLKVETEKLDLAMQTQDTTRATEPALLPGNIQREVLSDGVCVLTFDKHDSTANVFDASVLAELESHLDAIAHDTRVRSLVLLSAKPSIFIAGADLHALSTSLHSPAEPPSPGLAGFIEHGQRVFHRLSLLPIPTVAAIHGACVGGGLEVALACDYRVASPDKCTKLGLPETQLGILPAWGGCTRLPRLIGLPKALDMILKGKIVSAYKANKMGLVDGLAPRERLLELARQMIRRGKRHASPWQHLSQKAGGLLGKAVLPYQSVQVVRRTYGNYPAVVRALEVVCQSLGGTVEESLQREREAILQLVDTEACHNLMQLFFLQERSKKIRVDTGFSLRPPLKSSKSTGARNQFYNAPPIHQAAVIGAGVMGSGIAQWLSSHGLPVLLKDINPEAVGRGIGNIHKLFGEAVKRHVMTPVEARKGLDRISTTTTNVPMQHIDMVIEAAVEQMDLKKRIFRHLAHTTDEHTILATNTSALSVSELAAATSAPERVVGIHFFNPVHRMQLVEVIVGHETDPHVLDRAVRFVQQIGKLPVVVSDSPGFLVNRVLMPYLMEAVNLFTAGASVHEIDQSMLEFGMPMGPLRLLDEVGLDVARHVATTLAEHFRDRMQVPKVLDDMLEAGLLGRKSDHGFYHHQSRKPVVNDAMRAFQHAGMAAGFSRETLRRRMTLLMINEAARCLEEEVVTAPEDADFAMVMGTGFAPFRGGPLRYADTLGLETVVRAMQHEVEKGAPHFAPCALLQRKCLRNETFYPQKGADV